ncbi:MAG: TetR/AcrR family transcriptional regulator [Anaerohalosphaeraceae bacterium]|nr:TetR/AcrR family transcriptional regulator [Anaerohalosphaeraceae bacterium]
MTKTGLSRKERERLLHKEDILTAALKLFSDRGFHNVSMQEIAEQSEFSVGTLYKFFESKESLFAALIRSCANRVSDILIPILDEKADEKQKIISYIESHKRIIEEYASSIRLYLSQNLQSVLTLGPDVEPETDAVREVIRQKLSDVFESGMRNGIFKSVDPWITTLSLSAILESFIFSAIKSPEKISIDDGISRIKELFFTGIAKSLSVQNDI